MTTSTHVGPRVVQKHNIRDPKYVAKEKHIDPNGVYEIWAHEDIREAYERIFGDAVRAYNEKQNDSRRIIEDYLQKIKKSKQQHPCYEMIITIGNKDNHPSFKVSREILKEMFDAWEERNPNLALIGFYLHGDEPNGTVHAHVDFIPVAYNNSRGLEVQCSMSKALKKMGFSNKNNRYSETESIQWINREREYLDSLCRKRGLVIHHPNAGKGKKHLEKEQYILTQKINSLEKRLNQIKSEKGLTGKAVDFYDAFLKLSIENEFNPEFKELEDLIKQRAEYEKALFESIKKRNAAIVNDDICI